MERERKIKRAKELEKNEGRLEQATGRWAVSIHWDSICSLHEGHTYTRSPFATKMSRALVIFASRATPHRAVLRLCGGDNGVEKQSLGCTPQSGRSCPGEIKFYSSVHLFFFLA